MLKKLGVLPFIMLIGAYVASALAESTDYDDAITSAAQFDQQLVQDQGAQDIVMFLSTIEQGLSKQDVDALLGTPYSVEHLNDGYRWEYNVSIPTSSNAFMGCQYRIEFDKSNKVRSSDWRKSVCDLLYQQSTNGLDSAHQQKAEVFTLLSDVLFSFNQYHLSPNGIQALDRFIDNLLARYDSPVITVTGHTDVIGDAEANVSLSKLRAREVAKRFLLKGIEKGNVLVKGVGQTRPIVVCEGEQKDKALINCLAPNRRVEIEVYETPNAS